VPSLRIPFYLRQYVGGASEVPVASATVREALAELERTQPRLYPNICDETGKVRRHLHVFVNVAELRDLQGLDTALAPGDVVIILAAVSGG
jgi:molybdopterin synthase sulfur carrier subunit